MRRSMMGSLAALAWLGAAPAGVHATAAADAASIAAVAPAASRSAASRTAASREVPVTLRGSLAAMHRQHAVAKELGYTFIRTPMQMAVMEERGELVRLNGNDDYGFRREGHSMLALPEMGTFIERLAAAYRAACDEKLVVTSLTRPTTRQPSNAHRLSVHPAGMAVDLRVSARPACRLWLEEELLAMEERKLLDVTRERYPPHYHVALFPAEYMAEVAPLIEAERAELARAEEQAAAEARARAERAAAVRAAAMTTRQGPDGLHGIWLLLGAVGLVVPAGLGAVARLRRRSAAPDPEVRP